MFSDRMDSAQATYQLHPDFARPLRRGLRAGAAGRHFCPGQRVSPLFGHQKDAFFVDNRLCRFMNQVDLNRYFWDECMP